MTKPQVISSGIDITLALNYSLPIPSLVDTQAYTPQKC